MVCAVNYVSTVANETCLVSGPMAPSWTCMTGFDERFDVLLSPLGVFCKRLFLNAVLARRRGFEVVGDLCVAELEVHVVNNL